MRKPRLHFGFTICFALVPTKLRQPFWVPVQQVSPFLPNSLPRCVHVLLLFGEVHSVAVCVEVYVYMNINVYASVNFY